MSFFNMLNSVMDNDEPSGKVKLYQHDVKNAVRWGLAGGVALAGYKLFVTLMRRKMTPDVELIDSQESLHLDTIIFESFLQLQSYREVNVYLFSQAIHYTDRLLLLKDVLARGEVPAEASDKHVAWHCFKGVINRLTEFQYCVKEQLGSQHALAVHVFVNRIYEQLRKHMLDLMHLTRQFNVHNMVKQAEHAIKNAQRTAELRRNTYQEEEAET